MAGIGGSHVRAATAFIGSPRFLRYSFDAQAMWMQLQRYALDEKREFLPEEYTSETIAQLLGKPTDIVSAAIDELARAPRPIINALTVAFDGAEPVTLIRVRGAREKQPVGWRDESDLASVWNEINPADPLEISAFERRVVNQRGERGGSQPKDKSKVPQTQTKRKAKAVDSRGKREANAPQPLSDCLPNAERLCYSREEKIREEQSIRIRNANVNVRNANADAATAGTSPPGPAAGGATDESVDAPEPDTAEVVQPTKGHVYSDKEKAALRKRFDGLTAGWGEPKSDGAIEGRKGALGWLTADPAKVFAHVYDIDSDVLRTKGDPWTPLGHRLMHFKKPKDDNYDRAKKTLRFTLKD